MGAHRGQPRQAVRRGSAGSGKVVAIAAAIMISVFGAFVLGNDPTIKLFGLALASAVLFDAFIVRLIIVPAVMYQLDRRTGGCPAGWAGSCPPCRWSRPRTSPTRTPRSRMCPSCRPRALRTRPRRLAQARP